MATKGESPVVGTNKRSRVEVIKEESRRLRGTISCELARPSTHFGEDDVQLLKTHGVYQQYDRDTATARKKQGLGKEHRFMVRLKLPGGRLSAEQYLALDELAERYAEGRLRITTRQSIQFHGLVMRDLKLTIAALDDTLLTTFGACGDVVRNVVTTPAPIADAVHRRLAEDARRLSEELMPATRAYHEIWLDGEPLSDGAEERESLYGATYLPRKFKIGLTVPDDNSIDVLTNDLAIIALFDGDALQGYNLALGGGLGITHNKPETFPRLATPIAFIAPGDLIRVVKAVVALQRDYGDRADRRHARLKYLVHEKGEAWIKRTLEGYVGAPLAAARPTPPLRVPDHLGWHPQGDGRWWLGLFVPSGRIADDARVRWRSALREVIAAFEADPVFTPDQNILLSNLPRQARREVEQRLERHGVELDVSPLRRWSLACPALPTCGLALTEAERVHGPLIEAIGVALAAHGLGEERIAVRITGCPNGCARPYGGDIGIVGRMPGHYAIYVGGDFEGTRLSFRLLDKVALDRVAAVLEPLFARFAEERGEGEGFGDFCHRWGEAALRHLADRALADSARGAA